MGGTFGTPEGLRGGGCRTLWLYGSDSTVHVAGVAFTPEGLHKRWVPDSLAIWVSLHSEAGVALSAPPRGCAEVGARLFWLHGSASTVWQGLFFSALPRGCAEVGAGLSGYMGQPPQ